MTFRREIAEKKMERGIALEKERTLAWRVTEGGKQDGGGDIERGSEREFG